MQEVIHPDGDIQSRDNGLSAEQETGSTTAESQQHLNVETSEYESKDQHKKTSVLGKVKEKAKKLKSKVKKGLKIGSSGEKEIPSDEVSSIDSEGDDGESAVVQDQGIKDAASSLKEKPVQQIIEKNPQFKGEVTSYEGGAPSTAELVEDGKKPITPSKSDGPVDALQAVPTQYRDYYNNPTSDVDQVHSGQMNQEEQIHQASAGDDLEKASNGYSDLHRGLNLHGGLSDAFSESFLGAVDGSQHLQGPTFDRKSGSQGEGFRQEVESEKLGDNKSAELGLRDAASDKAGMQEEGSREEVESDKLSDRKSGELCKRDAASDKDDIHEGDNSRERFSSNWDREGNKGDDLAAKTSKDQGSEESPVSADLDPPAKTSKDQGSEESPVSADLDPQVNRRSEPTEDSPKNPGNLEGNILPNFEPALFREENQKPTLLSEARCEDGTDEERKAAPSKALEEKSLPNFEAAASRDENTRSGRKLSGSNSEMETSSENKQLDPPLNKKTIEAGEAFGIGPVNQSGYEADADSNPPSEEEGRIAVQSQQPTHSQTSQPYDSSPSLEIPDQTLSTEQTNESIPLSQHAFNGTPSQRSRPYDSSSSLETPDQTLFTPSEQTKESIPLSQNSFNGLSSVKDRLVDATSTAAEAVGSSVGYYSLPDSRGGDSLEADEESSQEPPKLESNKEGSLGGKRENSSQSVQEQAPAISESTDGSEGGGVRTWSQWLSQTITSPKPGSTPGTVEPNKDGENDMDTKSKVETENPLKD